MLYYVFDLKEWEVVKQANPSVSLFHAVMEQGVIEVPAFGSSSVLKPGREDAKC